MGGTSVKTVKLVGVAVVVVLAVVVVRRHLTASHAAVTKPLPTADQLHAPFRPFLPSKLPAGWSFVIAEPAIRPNVWLWLRTRSSVEIDLMEGIQRHPTLRRASLHGKHPVSRHRINGRTWVLYEPGDNLVTTTADGVDLLIRGDSSSQDITLARTLRRASL